MWLSLILAAFASCKVPELGTSASKQQFENDTRGSFVPAEQQEYLSFVYFKDPAQQFDRLLKTELAEKRTD